MTEIRRLRPDATTSELALALNRLVDRDNGNAGGRVWLLGDDGTKKALLGGATLTSTNYPLRVKSAVPNHVQVQHSVAGTDLMTVKDTGVTVASIAITGAATVGGTLTVTGATTLSTLGVSGAATVGGTLGVTGLTTLSTLTVTGLSALAAVTVSGTLGVTGAMTAAALATFTTGIATGALPAATGAIRMTNATGVVARNALNTADINVIRSDGSNNVLMGAQTGTADTYVLGTNSVRLQVGANQEFVGYSGGVVLGRSGGQVGFYGSTGASQPSTGGASSDLASVISLANALRTGVRALGLFA